MILICENCQTRYLVASSAIGEEGRKVRCTNCGHEWFQNYKRIDADFVTEPEPEVKKEIREPEPIPDVIKPVPEGSNLPLPAAEAAMLNRRSGNAGYLAALFVFIAIAALLVVFRKPVTHIWPPAAGLYQIMGLAASLPGEGLALEGITAVAGIDEHGVNTLEITGHIVNKQDKPGDVPSLLSALRTTEGKIYDVWEIKPPQEKLGPREVVEFHTAYPEIPDNIKDVSIRFMLPD
jgi:predicted Zn finger-like uncharacterized protein